MARNGKPLHTTYVGPSAAVNRLFYGCKNPIAVYELKLCLATGAVVEVTHVPKCLYPALLLLATIDPSIVSDVSELRALINAEYAAPVPGFWHSEGHLVSSIICGNLVAEDMRSVPDAQYVYTAYEELTNEYAKQRLDITPPRTHGHHPHPPRQAARAHA